MCTTRRRIVVSLVVLAASVSGTACAGGSEDPPAASTAATGPVDSTVASTSTVVLDAATELTLRLAEEWGDPVLAQQVVSGLEAEALATLTSKVPVEQIATTPRLSYQPDPVPIDAIDSIVVFAFGNRVAADGTVTAGPTNEQLAAATAALVQDRPVPVYAQWEVGDLLRSQGVPDVVSIEPVVGPDGAEVYLSTAGVAEQAVSLAAAAGVDLGTVGVIGFADHAVRCVATAEAAGMTAVVPAGVDLPTDYDPESGQAWTRDRATYLTTDLGSRISAA